MKCFDISAAVLDRLVETTFGHAGMTEEEGTAVKNRLEHMSATYRSGGSPDLRDPQARFGYVFCYFPANAYLIQLAFRDSRTLRRIAALKIRDNVPLRICLLGAGPGTDIAGITKQFSSTVGEEDELILEFTLVDKLAGWLPASSATQAVVSEALRNEGSAVQIDLNHITIDLTAELDRTALATLHGHDIYVCNHFISEVRDRPDHLESTLVAIVQGLPPAGAVLIADREEDKVVQMARSLVASSGLQITEENLHIKDIEPAEDSEVLKRYKDKIGRNPRTCYGERGLNQGAFWVAATRPKN